MLHENTSKHLTVYKQILNRIISVHNTWKYLTECKEMRFNDSFKKFKNNLFICKYIYTYISTY